MKPLFKNIIYFTNGSVGDFLMVLFFAELVYKSDRDISIHIITPRNSQLFRELASEYPFTINECNQRNLSGILNSLSLLKFVFKRSLVITPATPGKIPLPNKIFTKLISMGRGSRLVGFNDSSSYSRYIYDILFDFDPSILYSESMIRLAKALGYDVEDKIPKLLFRKDNSIFDELNLVENKYIVLHCCGSSTVRSFSEEEIVTVIGVIHVRNPTMRIVLTGSEKDLIHIDGALEGIPPTIASKILNLAGKISINELLNIIDHCSSYIGVDTGISHIAAMLGKKSLVISHSSSVFYWLPYYNSNTRIIYNIKDCSHNLHEGLKHLNECYNEENKYLLKVPIDTVLKYLEDF